MKDIKKAIKNMKKYFRYVVYSAKAELKSEVANSYLSWIWWILEPICMMIVYVFIVQIVFKTNEAKFPVFVYIGLSTWEFFAKMLGCSSKLMFSNKSIITKVYIPKYVVLLTRSFTYLFKTMVSFFIVVILMICFNVTFSWYLLLFIPIFLVLYVLTFGICCIIMNYGVYIDDLANVITIVLRLVNYLSGIFYNIETRIPEPLNRIMLNCNPIALIIQSFRDISIYKVMPNFVGLLIWFIIGIILCIIGVKVIHKYENSYAKVL